MGGWLPGGGEGAPAHPCTSELIGRIIQAVVAETGLPAGVFSLLFDNGHTVGQALVSDPAITAVGFTGSRSGGLALCAVAAQRQVPIPIYAEMSAINPVLLMPGALAANGKAIGVAFAQAQTLGAGQFCTNPGLLLSLAEAELDSFIAGVASAYPAIVPGTMLTENIHAAYQRSLDRLVSHRAVSVLARGTAVDGLASQPVLFGTSAAAFLSDRTLHEEVFGAASLVVRCADLTELERVLAALEGQLTASVHHAPSDCGEMARLMPILQQRAGRVLFGGFGTGVEVCDAMVHGGPFPATSDSRSTSVGSMAISRFLRPICFQDAPQELLPVDLRNAALAALPHRRNGVVIKP